MTSQSLHPQSHNRHKRDLTSEMIDLDGCDNSMTNIILATIRDADEQWDDFRNKKLDSVGELLGRELWANIHL